MTDDQSEPKPRTLKNQPAPAPKRRDFERLMKKTSRPPAKQRQAAKPPPQRHQRRGR